MRRIHILRRMRVGKVNTLFSKCVINDTFHAFLICGILGYRDFTSMLSGDNNVTFIVFSDL